MALCEDQLQKKNFLLVARFLFVFVCVCLCVSLCVYLCVGACVCICIGVGIFSSCGMLERERDGDREKLLV